MVASAVDGIDLFKIAGRSISGWIPSFKTGMPSHVHQPFCSQLEERLLLYLEYHPQVVSYARGDLVPSLPRPIDCRSPRTRRSRLATCLRASPMTICPMSWGRSDQERSSSPRREWRMTSAVIATSPKRRPPEGSHASNEASSGLGRCAVSAYMESLP